MSEGDGQEGRRKLGRPRRPFLRHPKKKAFIVAYTKMGVVNHAAEVVGVHSSTARRWYSDDEAFRIARDNADEDATDELELVARQEAFKGSVPLLIFLLKGRRPHIYRDRYDVRSTHVNVDQDTQDLRSAMQDVMHDPDFAELAERLANRLSQKAVEVRVVGSKALPQKNGRNGNGRPTKT